MSLFQSITCHILIWFNFCNTIYICTKFSVISYYDSGKISLLQNFMEIGWQLTDNLTKNMRSWLITFNVTFGSFTSPSGLNRFQPQIDRVQNRGTFLWIVIYLNISEWSGQTHFFRIINIPIPCPHAQLRGRTVIEKLWPFFGPLGRDPSQSPPCWIFRVKQIIHQSKTSERTTRIYM